MFTYVSLFSGMGGFDTAFNRQGFRSVLASEIDPKARLAYEILYGHAPKGDVTQIPSSDVPSHDVLLSGFPCVAFSLAGKRAGMDYRCTECHHEHLVTFHEYLRTPTCPECKGTTKPIDERGILFFESARIAYDKQPPILLFENVKGLLSHNGGKTLEIILFTLNEIGYLVDFSLLNSKHWVPQNRERVFIAASRMSPTQPYTIPSESSVFQKRKKEYLYKGLQTFSFPWPRQDQVPYSIRDILEEDVPSSYDLSLYQSQKFVSKVTKGSDIQKIGYLGKDREQCRVHSVEGVMPTITANNGGGRRPGGLILDGERIRKLTPLEVFRLQAFPDSYVTLLRSYGFSDSVLYKLAGNAVTVSLVEELASSIHHLLSQ
ncbi:DNA cytosine methyltransferase [Cytobacillus sp. FJAT-54145]|uniref:Cytosine-specific methyltransferase n=1 Tax=Cytobacillus spartinae TaxID=3299023 RepID=A0ABW6K9U6_9BACI